MSDVPRKGKAAANGAPAGPTEDEGFLSRWSRRKALSRSGVELPDPEVDGAEREPRLASEGVTPLPADETAAPLQELRSEPAEAEPLPPLESLGEDSDYSAFLKPDVPADLQRDALRKLFRSPKFNIRDGLDDYDVDFSQPEPLGDIVTAEMRRRLAQELERLVGLDGAGDQPESVAAATTLATDDNDDNDDNDDIQEQADCGSDDEQAATS